MFQCFEYGPVSSMLAEQNAMFPDPNQINSDKLIQIKTKLNAVYVCNEKNGSKKKRNNQNRNAFKVITNKKCFIYLNTKDIFHAPPPPQENIESSFKPFNLSHISRFRVGAKTAVGFLEYAGRFTRYPLGF